MELRQQQQQQQQTTQQPQLTASATQQLNELIGTSRQQQRQQQQKQQQTTAQRLAAQEQARQQQQQHKPDPQNKFSYCTISQNKNRFSGSATKDKLTRDLECLERRIVAQSKQFSERAAFFRPTNTQLGQIISSRPVGSPAVEAPLSTSKPGDNDCSRPIINNSIPVGLPRETASFLCALEITKRVDVCPIDSNNQGETQGWKCVKVGVDSCAAESVTPPGVFPAPVELTRRVGEEYTCANDTVIYNQGQQTVSAYTDDFVPVSTRFQVTDVNKPLMSVKVAKDNDNTILYSKKYGDWIINDITGSATRMVDENNTFHLPLWVPVFTRPV